jgi:3-dehydroquinate dehydratase-2
MKILVIHGPNLNLLGKREPAIYGRRTLANIDARIAQYARERDIEVETFQSNHEGAIIDRIQAADAGDIDAIVLNPGAYTHTSLAIADTIRAVSLPVVEVHLSNLHARGPERVHSLTATACSGIISGFGHESYLLGIDAAARAVRALGRPARRAAAKAASRRGKPGRRPGKRS